VIVTSGKDITHLWVANEVLLEKVYDLSAVTFEPDFIFDLGANIGLFSLIASSKWPDAKVICVEPHHTTFRYLGKNLDINGVKAAKFQCALDAHSGVKYLQNQGAVFQTITQQPTGTFTYCLKLDAFLESFGDGRLLIKMDIEGAEESVLDSLSVKLPPNTFIFIELHRGEAALMWVKQWASINAFRFVEVRRRDQAIDGFLIR
jgi:FkbM family methyltransferase